LITLVIGKSAGSPMMATTRKATIFPIGSACLGVRIVDT